MVKTYEIIDFERRVPDKKEFITKFGGAPDWIKKENCPLSLGWDDRKMTFIGQIFLKKDMLGNDHDLMVYIFMSQPEYFDDDFFDPDIADWDGGENAIIIQTFDGETIPVSGDDVMELFDENDEHFEYIPILKETQEPDFLSTEAYKQLDSDKQTEYFNEIDKDKIGGTPAFFTGDAELPDGNWKLLLQLHCNFQPFVLRGGAMPAIFVFISDDFKRAGMFIQDS